MLADQAVRAGLLRRLGAMLYDGLLVLALCLVMTFGFLPFTGGEAITPQSAGALAYVYRFALAAVIVAFFGVFWTRRGQTLGMAAWRLRVQRMDGSLLSWSDVLKRLALALVSWAAVGLGFVWVLIDRDRLAWHDRWTGTHVLFTPKR